MKNHTKILLHWIYDYQRFKIRKNVQSKSFIFIFKNVNEYFEEINGNKYLTLIPTNESKELIKNIKNFGVKSDIQIFNQVNN